MTWTLFFIWKYFLNIPFNDDYNWKEIRRWQRRRRVFFCLIEIEKKIVAQYCNFPLASCERNFYEIDAWMEILSRFIDIKFKIIVMEISLVLWWIKWKFLQKLISLRFVLSLIPSILYKSFKLLSFSFCQLHNLSLSQGHLPTTSIDGEREGMTKFSPTKTQNSFKTFTIIRRSLNFMKVDFYLNCV